jgi:hypothetical protein
MARGQKATVGSTRISPNGYHYTRTEDRGWRLTHHIVAEEELLHRPLATDEMVRFKGARTDLSAHNLVVVPKKTGSLRRRKAVIEARIDELQAELDEINKELDIPK